MRPVDLQNELKKRPFQPFRIRMTDQTTYEVRHPELIVPGLSSIFVGVPPKDQPDSGVYDRYHIISYFHVMRLEPVAEAQNSDGNGYGSTSS